MRLASTVYHGVGSSCPYGPETGAGTGGGPVDGADDDSGTSAAVAGNGVIASDDPSASSAGSASDAASAATDAAPDTSNAHPEISTEAGSVAPTETAATDAARDVPGDVAEPGPAEVVGQMIGLMSQSPAHKFVFLSDLEWMVLPAVGLRQFRVYRNQGNAVAFATWAFVDEERENRLKGGQSRLAPAEWRCGDRIWLFDLVAPFGNADEVIQDIRRNVFPDKEVRTIRLSDDGKEWIILEWPRLNKESNKNDDN